MFKKVNEMMGNNLMMESIIAVKRIELRIKLISELVHNENTYLISCYVFGTPDISVDLFNSATYEQLIKFDVLQKASVKLLNSNKPIEQQKDELKSLSELL